MSIHTHSATQGNQPSLLPTRLLTRDMLRDDLRHGSSDDAVLLGDPELRRAAERSGSERHLLCRACGARVTSEQERVPIEGRLVHRRTNPAGIEFEFGCFLAAPGATVAGQRTAEFSWFPGYAWAYSLCRACHAHLGWHFDGRAPAFHGLILERLRARDRDR